MWEYILRFVFGGAITVATGLVASHYGPAVGGMFLAFPAILPASLTLVERHDGRAGATDNARGARLGALALPTDGAAPNSPEKVFGWKSSPVTENADTIAPPIKKRIKTSVSTSP